MTTSQVPLGQPSKLLSGGAIKIRIALASGLALTLGAWLMPRAAQTTLSVPQEHAAPLLDVSVHPVVIGPLLAL